MPSAYKYMYYEWHRLKVKQWGCGSAGGELVVTSARRCTTLSTTKLSAPLSGIALTKLPSLAHY